MTTMSNGSERLADGTYVRVTPQVVRCLDGSTRQEPSYVAKVVGADMGRTKYEVGVRCGGWGEWLFTDGGSWAFPSEVAEIAEEEALKVQADEA